MKSKCFLREEKGGINGFVCDQILAINCIVRELLCTRIFSQSHWSFFIVKTGGRDARDFIYGQKVIFDYFCCVVKTHFSICTDRFSTKNQHKPTANALKRCVCLLFDFFLKRESELFSRQITHLKMGNKLINFPYSLFKINFSVFLLEVPEAFLHINCLLSFMSVRRFQLNFLLFALKFGLKQFWRVMNPNVKNGK